MTVPRDPTAEQALAAWRELVPHMPVQGLQALHAALEKGDQRVGRFPPIRVMGGELYQCYPVAFVMWQGLGLTTAEMIEEALKPLPTEALATVYEWWAWGDPAHVRRELADELWRHLPGGAVPPAKGRKKAGARG